MYPPQKDITLTIIMTNLKNILKEPLFANTAKMSSSNIVMYLIPIFVTPFLTRIYAPSFFGEWGIFSSFAMIYTIVLFVGFENTIVKVKEWEIENTIALCSIVSLFMILGLITLFYFGNFLKIQFFQDFPCYPILIIYLLLHSFYTLFYNLANRYEKYTALSIANIINGTGQAAFRILFGIGIIIVTNGLILGTTIAIGLTTLVLFLYITKVISNWNISRISIIGIIQLIKKYKSFPLFDAPASLLSYAAFNLPTIILSFYFDKTQIGCFSILLQLLLIPMSLIGSSIGKVFYQELCKGDQSPMLITGKVIKIMAVISVLPMLFLSLGGDKIVVFFLGDNWQAAGQIALCLALWSFPTILTQPLLPIYRYANKQHVMLRFDTMYFVLGLGSIIITGYAGMDIYNVLLSYSCICTIVKLFLFYNILSIVKLPLTGYKLFFPIWSGTIVLLIFRLILL